MVAVEADKVIAAVKVAVEVEKAAAGEADKSNAAGEVAVWLWLWNRQCGCGQNGGSRVDKVVAVEWIKKWRCWTGHQGGSCCSRGGTYVSAMADVRVAEEAENEEAVDADSLVTTK